MKIILTNLFIFCALFLYSQDIEKIGENLKNLLHSDPLSMTGGIGLNSVFYDSKGIPARRDPFYWAINGNLNFTVLGKISCPLTFTLTQQDKNFSHGLDKFSQPFNQFGISPKYKWLTVHAGYRSMSFSEYSLNGSLFLGGGVEIQPEKGIVSGKAAFGRFLRAIPKGGLDGVSVALPAYERWGGAANLKLGKEKSSVELTYFRAEDIANSIPFDTSNSILPSENQVIGLGFKHELVESLILEGDYHFSMMNPNTYLPESKIDKFTYLNKIFSPRANSQFNSAYNLKADYKFEQITIGAKYKRIDPDYKTLGSVFIANDVQEISGSVGRPFLKNKLVLNFSLGITENNLDKKQIATQRRIAASGSASINMVKNLNVNLSYNSFSSDIIAIQDIFYDSIRLTQLNQTGNANISYNFGEKVKSMASLNCTYQETGGNKQAKTGMFMLNPSYNLTFTKWNFGILLAGSLSANNTLGNKTINVGPTIGLNSSILKKKCKIGANFTYQDSRLNSTLTNQNFAIASFLNYSINKSNSFKVNYAFINKTAVVVGAQDFIENRLTLGYNYNFGTSYNKIKERLKKD